MKYCIVLKTLLTVVIAALPNIARYYFCQSFYMSSSDAMQISSFCWSLFFRLDMHFGLFCIFVRKIIGVLLIIKLPSVQ